MGDDDEKPQDVNVQEIGTDPQVPGSNPKGGLGTNFTHGKPGKNVKDDDTVNKTHNRCCRACISTVVCLCSTPYYGFKAKQLNFIIIHL
jgi:hypothetical protein